MQQLSGLDATFLYLETPEMPMHVGALHVFELPSGQRGRFVTALRKHIAARLPLAPPLRRRLWWMPLNMANPAWVDAEPDLREHIVEHRLPTSARQGDGRRELEEAVAALHVQLLDRRRPLWKFHVLEGLGPSPAGLRRVALYTQLHHAAVDGQAAVALANAILDVAPVPPGDRVARGARRRKPTFELGMTEMLRGVLGHQAQKVGEIVRGLPSTVGTLKDVALKAAGALPLLGGKEAARVSNLQLAPRTPLNVSVTTGRAFATVSLPLSELRALAKAHGATLNDLVLWLCGTALRRHLARHEALPRKSLVAAVPISLRELQADAANPGNQASMSLVSLGTHLADPARRLAHVMAASRSMKSTMGGLKGVLPTDFPSLGVPWLMEAATAIYGRAKVAERVPQLANLVISNVPGPPVPLYLAGAKMLTNYPASIVVHGVALNITVQSYDRHLDFGLMADAQALPDVRELADAVAVACADLQALLRAEDTVPSATDLVGRAARGIGQAVSDTVGGMVGGAVRSAVSGVVGGVVKGAVGRATRPAARKR